MNKKQWILIIILTIATAFVGTCFVLSGQPFTIQGLTTFAITGGIGLITTIMTFVTTQWQLLVGAVGSIVATVGGAYKLISSKINSTKEQFTTQLQDERQANIQQFKEFQDKFEGQEVTIQQQTEQIKTLTAKLEANTYNEEYAKQLETQLQSKMTEVNTLNRIADPTYVTALEKTITENGLRLPVKDANIQLVTVVK